MGRSERYVAGLTAAALIPVWWFRFFPAQDGPSHLYNAFVLGRLHDAPLAREYFAVHLLPFPNWTTYLLMAALTRVLPPLIVMKITLSLCVIAIPASVLYLQKSFVAANATALIGPLLAFNQLLFLGFFNFLLGAALFAVTVGYWWRYRKWRLTYLLLALTYFTHGLPFVAAVMAIALLSRSWRIAPAALVVVVDAATRLTAAREYRSFAWHLESLFDLAPVGHLWIGRIALLLIAVAVARSRKWQPMTLVTIALFAGFCIAPWGYGAGGWTLGGWIDDRLLFLTLITLPAWLTIERGDLIAVVLVIAQICMTVRDAAQFNQRVAWVEDATAHIRPHTTIARIGGGGAVLHVPAYLALRDDVVYLDDYEANLRDFPLRFRARPLRPPDYVLVWRDAHVRNVTGYRMIFKTDEVRLFSRAGL